MHRAWEAVEDEAVFRIWLSDAVGDDRNDNVIGAKLAPIHDVLDLQPDRSSGLDRGAQHVTG